MKNYFLMFAILIATVITPQNINAQTGPFGGGNGSEISPFEIYTKEHLEELADSVNNCTDAINNWSFGKYFILMCDINDSVTTIVGAFPKAFQGNFDGQNFQINLAIDYPGSGSVGLFGYFGSTKLEADDASCYIKNIVVYGFVNGDHGVGGIVGHINCYNRYKTISNCINMANINGATNGVGGIVGGNNQTMNIIITNCLNLGNIKGDNYVGGIIGYDFYSLISHSINAGFVKGNNYAGGILGFNWDIGSSIKTTITDCINVGVVEGNAIGGISEHE